MWEMISDTKEHLWCICCGTLICEYINRAHNKGSWQAVLSVTLQGRLVIGLTCSVCTWHQTSCSWNTLGMFEKARTLWKIYKGQKEENISFHYFVASWLYDVRSDEYNTWSDWSRAWFNILYTSTVEILKCKCITHGEPRGSKQSAQYLTTHEICSSKQFDPFESKPLSLLYLFFVYLCAHSWGVA